MQQANDCSGLEARVVLLVGGELSGDEAREVEAHLAACPACSAERAALERTNETLRAGWIPPLEAGDREALIARARRARTRVRVLAAAAALVAVLLPAGIFLTVRRAPDRAGWDADISFFDLDQ